MAAMSAGPGRWLVLCRDVSDRVRVEGEPQIRGCLILDMDTGLIRGVAMAAGQSEAVEQAVTMGLTKPAGPLAAGPPVEVMCAPGMSEVVAAAVGAAGGGTPPVGEIDPPAEAEDIFDSLVGHLAGRGQPGDPPEPEDWDLLYQQAARFCSCEPWARWHDGIDLVLEIRTTAATSRHAVVVMGNAGIQRGLVLYPDDPATAGGPGRAGWPGTVVCTLDPRDELPAQLAGKADRYGWPEDLEVIPAVSVIQAPDEGADPGADDLQKLTVALAAVVALDSRGPVLAGSKNEPASGEVELAGGQMAAYSLRQRPPRPDGSTGLVMHQVGFDLVPRGTPVVLGHLPWESLHHLRSQARIHRPFPVDAPRPAGREVPLIVIVPKPRRGDSIAARTAELDPFGVGVFDTGDGNVALALAGANGAEALMEAEAANPGIQDFHRRMRDTKGLHVVMVADQGTSRGEGIVYGLFECHQPPPPAPAPPPRTPAGRAPTGAGRAPTKPAAKRRKKR